MPERPHRASAQPRVLEAVSELLAQGSLAVGDLPLDAELAASLGLRLAGSAWLPPSDWTPLDPAVIRSELGGRASHWLDRLDVYPVIGSTNAELASRAESGTIAGHACLAEVQLSGRGRRGRSWLSPLGGNIAMSLGFAAPRPPSELGGLSLVVGLALLDALESSGVACLALKWPNDILLRGAKLGGILIELVQTPAGPALVVGVGINVRLPDGARSQLDHAVADLAGSGVSLPGRSILVARLINSLVQFTDGFAQHGFGPFAELFDRRHAFQGADITLLQGDRVLLARVLGVAPDGGLRIVSESGESTVHGGEVSLRPAPPAQ